ncbi:MAG: enoyl-CoA hydratase/isomerase family protein [Actinomycetota bacterium]
MSIDVTIAEGVATIVMNRPERKNAFDRAQYDALAAALASLDADSDVRVAVLTGAGGAFSSGQDLKEMTELAQQASSGTISTSSTAPSGFTVLLDALEVFSKPLIAAVNGVAVGIGMTLLPFCDLVLVGASARLRMPFSDLGVPPEAASSVTLPDLIGWQRAADLLLTARWVDAPEAVELGLALRVEPDAELLTAVHTLAATIAAKSPYATRVIKETMVAGRGSRIREARAREEKLYTSLFRSGGFGS